MNLKKLIKSWLFKKEAASKASNASTNIDPLDCHVDEINLEPPLYLILDEQYKRALVRMLFNEVLFRLKCRAEKEKNWWYGKKATVCLEKNKSVAPTENSLRGCIHELLKIDREVYQGLFSSVSFIAIDSKLWSVKSDEERVDNYSISDDSIVQFRYDQLKTVLKQKEIELERQLARQRDVKNTECYLGLDHIPEYKTAAVERKIAIERTVLNVKCPGLSNSFLPIALPASQSDPEFSDQPEESQTLSQKIKAEIKKLYDYQDLGVEPDRKTLLDHVLTKTGKGWFRRPLEYRTVENLLIAAENSNLNEAGRLDVQRRIDRLKEYKKFKTVEDKQEALKRLETAFDVDRSNAYLPKMNLDFEPTGTQVQLKDSLIQSDIVFHTFQNYGAELSQGYSLQTRSHNMISIIEQLDVEKKLPGQENAPLVMVDAEKLPNTQIELQERASLIVQQHLYSSANASDPFVPDAGLLTALEPVFAQSRSLYFVALMTGLTLTFLRTKKQRERSAPLQELFNNILEGHFDPEKLRLNKKEYSDLKLDWLLAYLPSQITSASVAVEIKAKLLSLFSDEQTTRDSITSTKLATTPPRNNSFGERFPSHFSVKATKAQEHDRDLVSEELFLGKAREYAQKIIGTPKAVAAMNSPAIVNFCLYPNAPKSVVLLYTLLEWYLGQCGRDETLQPYITDCFALQLKVASYLENFRDAKNKEMKPVKRLVKYPTCYLQQEINASSLAIDIQLTTKGCTEGGTLGLKKWITSAGKLSERISHIFESGHIDFVVKEAAQPTNKSLQKAIDYAEVRTAIKGNDNEESQMDDFGSSDAGKRTGSASTPIRIPRSHSLSGGLPTAATYSALPTGEEPPTSPQTATGSPLSFKGFFSSSWMTSPARPKSPTLQDITNEVASFVQGIFEQNKSTAATNERHTLSNDVADAFNSPNYKLAFKSTNYQEAHKTALVLYCVLCWYSRAYGALAATGCGVVKTRLHNYLVTGWKTDASFNVEMPVINHTNTTAHFDALMGVIHTLYPPQATNSHTL